MMSKLHELTHLGQAIWYDYIRRAFITTGELQSIIDTGVRGITSNPTIFEKAIAGSADYDEDLGRLVAADKSVDNIYEALVLDDITSAAQLLSPVYQESGGNDGYVSLEVSPTLAYDTPGTLSEARRLFATLDLPNVMIKVPATPQGIPAVEMLISEGININVTLIFSLAQYEAVAEAYITGLEKLAARGGDVSKVASVASFFVSRVDTAVDQALERVGRTDVQGRTAIANAKVAYARFQDLFQGERWERLAKLGARVQRPLWASTGTKNPLYPDTLYVDSLIGRDTVNTVPPATLQAFLDHGTVASPLETGVEEARTHLSLLASLGIDLDVITKRLEDEGVKAFAQSFEKMMNSITEKCDCLLLLNETRDSMTSLGTYQAAVDTALAELKANKVIQRIWSHDYTIWKPEPTEITNRLGWLHSPEMMVEHLSEINAIVEAVRADGYTHALLLGMGGSSLAPEVFLRTFGTKEGYLKLAVLDSTDPKAVLASADQLDLERTLFIVSTKSGGTVETFSFFKFFYNQMLKVVSAAQAGAHFIAITDPGSALADTAKTYHFRATFINDPNIGGRYSALSYFGLVPAALIGMDTLLLLDRAATMASNCESCNCPVEGNNSGAWLGAVMGELAAIWRSSTPLNTTHASVLRKCGYQIYHKLITYSQHF